MEQRKKERLVLAVTADSVKKSEIITCRIEEAGREKKEIFTQAHSCFVTRDHFLFVAKSSSQIFVNSLFSRF